MPTTFCGLNQSIFEIPYPVRWLEGEPNHSTSVTSWCKILKQAHRTATFWHFNSMQR